VPGPTKEVSVRLVKLVTNSAQAQPGCTPDIQGLFLQDGSLEWTLTEKAVNLSWSQYSIIPVRLIGAICDADVSWSTYWQPSGYSGNAPIFFGSGPVGIVGFYMLHDDRGFLRVDGQPGLLTISATCLGVTYGPVEITFTSGGYYY
jgi:hypothetical protein